MSKTVTVAVPVEDLYGLYVALRKSYFDVKNVGSGSGVTNVILGDSEDKDPTPIVESLVGKVPEIPLTREAIEARKAEFASLPSPSDMPPPSVAMLEVDGDHVLGQEDPVAADRDEAAHPDSMLRRILRKIF